MKLFSKMYSNVGGRVVTKGSNDILIIELYNGNYMQGMLTMNIFRNELVYNKLDNNAFVPVYREKLKQNAKIKA
jgi:hypothetical protein